MIFLICLGCVLLVALAQEAVQMISTQTSDLGAALFDLGVDLTAGAIPPVVHLIRKKKTQKQQA